MGTQSRAAEWRTLRLHTNLWPSEKSKLVLPDLPFTYRVAPNKVKEV